MSTITISSADVTIKSDEEMLAEINEAILAVVTTGQSYTIFGSRVVTKSNLGELKTLQSSYEQRILLKKGWTGRNYIDNSGDEASGETPA